MLWKHLCIVQLLIPLIGDHVGVTIHNWLFPSSDGQDITFLWMEAHLPSFFPFSKFIQVILKSYTIDIRCYGKIYDGIISEQSGFGSYIFWHVVGVE